MAVQAEQEKDRCLTGENACSENQSVLRHAQLRLLDMLLEFHRICEKHDIKYYISGGTCLGAIRHGGFIPWDDDVDIDIWYEDYAKILKILSQELPDQYQLQTNTTDSGFYGRAARIVDLSSKVTYPKENFVRRKFLYQGLFIDLMPVASAPSLLFKRFIDKFGAGSFCKKKAGGLTDYKTYVGWVLWPAMAPIIQLYQYAARHCSSSIVTHYHASMVSNTPDLRMEEIFPVRPILFEGCNLYGPNNPDAYLTRLYGDYSSIPPQGSRRIHAAKIDVYPSGYNKKRFQKGERDGEDV